MTKEIAKELDEKELLEILELAKLAEQAAQEMCELITANNAKYQSWYEAKKVAKSQQKKI
jgi:predicted Zn-dependent protease